MIPGGGRSLNTGVWDAFPISWVCRSADQDTGRSNVFLLTSVRVSGSTIGVRPRSILVPFQLSSIKHRWPQHIGRAIQCPLGGFRIFQMSLPWDSWWPSNLANRALRSVPWSRLSKEFLVRNAPSLGDLLSTALLAQAECGSCGSAPILSSCARRSATHIMQPAPNSHAATDPRGSIPTSC